MKIGSPGDKRTLITKELEDKIGAEVELGGGQPIEIERAMIRNCAAAIGYSNPLYYDEEYAKSLGYRSIIAPPCFGVYNLQMSDGMKKALELPFEIGGAVAAGNEWEFFQPIQAGDIITPKGKVIDIYEKEGQRGRLVYAVVEVKYTNQFGELVAVFLHRTAYFPKEAT